MNSYNKVPFRYSDYRIEAPVPVVLENYIVYRKKASEDSSGVVNETTISRTQGLLSYYNELEIKNRTVFFVTEKRGVVGELFLSGLAPRNYCRIDLLFLLKKHRYIGLGSYLLNLTFNITKKAGCLGVYYVIKKDDKELKNYAIKKGFKSIKNKEGNEILVKSFGQAKKEDKWLELR